MTDDKVVSLEEKRLSKLPMLDTNIDELSVLIERFVNQCVAMGHREFCGSFQVGNLEATIDVRILEKK